MACCGDNAAYISAAEFNINQSDDHILSGIYAEKPAVVGFSCYIWNIVLIERLLPDIRKLLPGVLVVLGGPEAAYNGDRFLYRQLCDFVATGEGEANFPQIADAVIRAEPDAAGMDRGNPEFRRFLIKKIAEEHIDGVNYLHEGRIIQNPPVLAGFGNLPFGYAQYGIGGHIVYYESARGCYNGCAYCLAGAGGMGGVRYKPVDAVKDELGILIKKGAKLVKFTDRTFNADKKRAMEIWRFLSERRGGCVFHFEIGADLLDAETLAMLKSVGTGVFQFEIGVQTTDARTLETIGRRTDLHRLFDNVRVLKSFGNIRLHLDLIAGLPGEDFATFARSFDDVYALGPDHLQLGFLKALPGTALFNDAAKHGIAYRETAPYEVLFTTKLPYGDIIKLKRIEDVFGRLYNTRSFTAVLKYARTRYNSAFRFYEEFTYVYETRGLFTRTPAKLDIYDAVREFLTARFSGDAGLIQELVKFDILLTDNVKSIPFDNNDNEACRDAIRALLKSKNDAAGKRTRAEQFTYNIGEWHSGVASIIKEEPNFCLFTYPRAAGEGTRYEIIKT